MDGYGINGADLDRHITGNYGQDNLRPAVCEDCARVNCDETPDDCDGPDD